MTVLRNYWLMCALGCAALVGFAAYPSLSNKALADEGRNPRIHHALEALRDAKHELEEAPHDFHGERAKAIEDLDHAIERLDRIKDW